MCGRTITGPVDWEQYHDWMNILKADDVPEITPRYNAPPTSMNPVFLPEGNHIRGVLARWGLVPAWHKGSLADMRYATFNARAEDAANKPAFRDAMRSGHCLVPVQGYYEWKGQKGQKTPYVIKVATNAPAFCLAGLFTEVKLPDFQGYTYSVLTEPSRAPIETLHSRMPVMLDETSYENWLQNAPLTQISRVDPARISFHPVDKRVGNVRNDDPTLIDPVY